jgi:L-malate glycosyltransferase
MMRVLIISPSAYPQVTGNAITTERWRRSLADKSVNVEIIASNGLDAPAFLQRLDYFHPDLIHVHHAFKAGTFLLNSQIQRNIESLPLVVSPGGTDVNVDLGLPERRETILSILGMARIIVTQSLEISRRLQQQLPDLADKIIHIPKAATWFGNDFYDLRKIAGCEPENILFFLPAGIRPVKGNLECLMAMETVYKARPNSRFVAAGPAADVEYAGRFRLEVNKRAAFAHWIGTIPASAMRSAYEASDIVLNASFSEGLSNSLLEAITAGRPILASDIPGNRQRLLGEDGHQPACCLYHPGDPEDFAKKAIRLIDDEGFRKTLAGAACLLKSRLPKPEEEAIGLIAAYETALSKKAEGPSPEARAISGTP